MFLYYSKNQLIKAKKEVLDKKTFRDGHYRVADVEHRYAWVTSLARDHPIYIWFRTFTAFTGEKIPVPQLVSTPESRIVGIYVGDCYFVSRNDWPKCDPISFPRLEQVYI